MNPLPPGSARRAAGDAALLAVLVYGLARLVHDAAGGWHASDDFQYLRWALEELDQPWVALTELPAMYQHVRPAVLLSSWLGLTLSDGGWGGPHALLVLYTLGGFAGVVGLGARLHSLRAGLIAGLLTLGGPLASVLGWNSWVGSAGEWCFGMWAVIAAHIALRGRPWAWLPAALCLVVSGLFKESGWLVYPVVICGLCWQTAWALRVRRPAAPAAGALLLGVGGIALTHTPENTDALGTMDGVGDVVLSLGPRAADLIQTWPGLSWSVIDEPIGIGWLAVAAVLVGTAFAPRPPAGWLLAGTAATGAVWLLYPTGTLPLLFGLAVLVAMKNGRDSHTGLLLLGTSLLAIAPAQTGEGPHTLQATAGLALMVAVGAGRLLDGAGEAGRRWLTGLFAAALVLHLVPALQQPASPAEGLVSRAEFEAKGALLQTFGVPELSTTGAQDIPDESALALPLVGTQLVVTPTPGGPPPLVFDGDQLLHVDASNLVAAHNLLAPGGLPTELTLEAGAHALGLLATDGRVDGVLHARDACDQVTAVTAPDSAQERGGAVALVVLQAGCGPLMITAQGPVIGTPFLVPLQPAHMTMPDTPARPRFGDLPPDSGRVGGAVPRR